MYVTHKFNCQIQVVPLLPLYAHCVVIVVHKCCFAVVPLPMCFIMFVVGFKNAKSVFWFWVCITNNYVSINTNLVSIVVYTICIPYNRPIEYSGGLFILLLHLLCGLTWCTNYLVWLTCWLIQFVPLYCTGQMIWIMITLCWKWSLRRWHLDLHTRTANSRSC